ncbi:MAG: N-6 DNA methylase [Nocardioides sp.]|uniref:N-6 DNA methylase n=1 Tax=Nocardioides sp. TaxID=35761 RepID=UPI003266B4BA
MNTTPGQALLAPSDIAKLGDVSAAAVSNWRKRSSDFPHPAGGTDTRPLFARDEVLAWMGTTNKTVVGLSTSNAIAAMNLVREISYVTAPGMDQAGALDDAARLIVTLLAARKLSDEDASAMPLWQNFLSRADRDGFASLSELGRGYGIDRWDDLVELPAYADRIPPASVAQIARLVDDIPVGESSAAADAVLARAVGASGRGGSEHGYVGSRVSEFLAQISAADAHGRVYDPACGIGDVLTRLFEMDAAGDSHIQWMVAHDVNEAAIVLADQRGLLRDAPIELLTVDVLAKDPAPDLKADLIVAEPPYGHHYEGYDLLDPRWHYGIPGKSSSELAWIQHAVAHLATDGVAYVATSGSPLYRTGPDGDIRRGLVADGCVRAVYQLPAKLLQHTSIPVAVWVLGRPGSADSIRFVNAQSFTVSRGGRVELQPFAGRAAFENMNPFADVSTADILAGDTNLVPERWIGLDTPDPTEVVSEYAEAVARIHSTGEAAKSADLHEFHATSPVRVVTIGDLEGNGALEIQTGRPGHGRGDDNDPRRVTGSDIVRGQVNQTPVNSEALAGAVTEPGDVLVATVGQLAAALDEFGGHTLGPGVVALRATGPQLRAAYLAVVVDGKWNKRFFTGTTLQRVKVRELEIPLLTSSDQEAFALAATDLHTLRRLAGELSAASADALESLAEVARYGTDLNGA